ncbi:MAG TPA: RNA polymerase sigma factor [Solirubrobacteraceae bacterium]|nr:RNA polymerase sigma factor [Solirubrobacteraceae bacterium]
MDLEHLSDEELLVRAREDARAFGVFYRRHVPAVHRYFRRRVLESEVAFDLTAETFAAALRSVPRYVPRPEPARAWLFGVARHTLSAAYRQRQVDDRARRALAMEPITLDDADVEALELVADTPALEAVERLPSSQRAAVIARHVDGDAYAEIAERLACSESVVRQRVSRGLATLRAQLEEGRG